MKSYRDKNGFEVKPGENWDDKKSDQTMNYLTKHTVKTLNKFEDKPNVKAKKEFDPLRNMLIEDMKTRNLDSDEIRYLIDTKDRTELSEATPEQFGQLAERLERNRQMTGAAPTKFKNLEARFKKPKPITKVKKRVDTPVYVPNVSIERAAPITRTPEEIEQEKRFNEMLRQDKERKIRDQNSGLGGLINPMGKRYV
ncbi:MAG: hypothetical protein L7S72_05975 [Flavobacteriales bacterium]|nr:hypothetical protein [Flavobacteriales bacterium]